MRILLVAAISMAGCESKQPAPQASPPPAPAPARTTRALLVDIDASLAAVRTAFNAQKGHARFLTLLSPT